MTTSLTSSSSPPRSPSPTSTPKLYPQLLLFGDSIIQGCNQTLLARLSNSYSRRLDVINRGFSGYNAPAALSALPHFFPSHSPSSTNPRVRLMTVFFGANDATIPGDPQHVPLKTYQDCMRQIALHSGVKLHGTKVIIIVPGPVDEWQLETPNRNAEHTAMYAAACREVAHELGLPVLDLWTIFMRKAGWRDGEELVGSKKAPRSRVFAEMLSDGLHFTDKAYGILFDELVKVVKEKYPEETPDTLPWVFPDWKEVLVSTSDDQLINMHLETK